MKVPSLPELTKSRELVDSLSDYVFTFDPGGVITSANKPLRNRLGYKKEEIVGRKLLDLYPPRLHQEIETIISSREKNPKKGLTAPLLSKGGDEIPAEAVFFQGSSKNGKFSCCVCRDVADGSRTGKLLQEQVYFLQTLIDAVPTPIYYKGLDLKYLGVNKAFTEYHGLQREKLLGSTLFQVFPENEAQRHDKIDQNLLKNGGSVSYEFTILHPDGSLHDVINNKAIFKKPDGSVAGIVGVITDITERKRARKNLSVRAIFWIL